MKVLVTGATGFLGRWVTRALVEAGYPVRVLMRRLDRLRELSPLEVDGVQGDILSRDSLAAAVRGVDAVVHCAGMVSWRPRDREAVHRVNVGGTRNVLDAAASRGVRVLHTSSIATIGATRRPFVLDEGSAAVPLDFDCAYTESKRSSEGLALARAWDEGADVVVLNPGVLFGPGDVHFMSTQVVLRYLRGEIHHYLEGGTSFCDVRDVAAAYVNALENGESGERYILAGVNRSHAELREVLRRLTGLQRCYPLPQPIAEWGALWSELSAAFVPHGYEDFNLAVARWGSRFAYFSSRKAECALDYRARRFSDMVADTIVDHIERGAARACTPELRRLLERSRPTASSDGPPRPARARSRKAQAARRPSSSERASRRSRVSKPSVKRS